MTTADESSENVDATMATRALGIIKRRVKRGATDSQGKAWTWPVPLMEFCHAEPPLKSLFRFALSRGWDAYRAGAIPDPAGRIARRFRALHAERAVEVAMAEAIGKLEEAKTGLMSSMKPTIRETDHTSLGGHAMNAHAGVVLVVARVAEELREQRVILDVLATDGGADEELGEFPSLFALPPRARSHGLTRQCLALAASGVQHKEIAFILDLRGNDVKQIVETVRNRLKRGRKRGRQPPDEMT